MRENIAPTITTEVQTSNNNFILELSIITPPHGYFKGDRYDRYSPTVDATEYKGHHFVMEQEINTCATRTRAYKGQPETLEIGDTDAANTITSVAKDSMIIMRPHGYFGGGHSDIAPTVKSSAYRENNYLEEQTLIGWTRDEKGKIENLHPVENVNCVTAMRATNTQNYVVEKRCMTQQRTEKAKELRRQGIETFANREFAERKDGLSGTITTVEKDNYIKESMKDEQRIVKRTRIRKLTERELFRLMDVDEADIDTLLSAGISNTQLAKMAGNSIVVACLYHIFKSLLIDTEPQENTQLTIF